MDKVIALVGPTAVGKTAIGIEIAKRVGGEIISADSRQVYRELDIGTGKVTRAEMDGIPHHLINVADPETTFTASDFVHLGRAAIADITARGKVPIVVGGTGFYIDTLLGRMSLAEVPPDPTLREGLSRLNLAQLQARLQNLDPSRYATIDTKNRRRLERAIEIVSAPIAPVMIYHDSPYKTLWIGLMLPLPELKDRIRIRLFARIRAGMVDEAKRLHAAGLTYQRMEELGLEYRYMARHLQGLITEDEMRVQLEKEIVAYAKRQMTWFKKNKEIRWFDPCNKEEIIKRFLDFLEK